MVDNILEVIRNIRKNVPEYYQHILDHYRSCLLQGDLA